MDLWERIRGLDFSNEENVTLGHELVWRRSEERMAEIPVPFCCPLASGSSILAAGFREDADVLDWVTQPFDSGRRLPLGPQKIEYCPFCGTKLPGFVLKRNPPPHVMQKVGTRCVCGEPYGECFCSYPESCWEAKGAPPIEAVAAVVGLGSNPRLYLSVSRKHDPSQKGCPGGKIEAGETPEQALVRELQEETGLTALEFHRAIDLFDDCGARCVMFHVTKWTGVVQSSEKGVIEWLTPEVLMQDSPFRRSNQALFSVLYPYASP